MDIRTEDLSHPSALDLVALHLREMHATSPACSVHALDTSGLTAPDVTVWSAWDGASLLGMGALKQISPQHGEIKSMRTAPEHLGRGVGTAILTHLLEQARRRGYTRVSLETGTQDLFRAAHRLYLRHGFVDSAPFADYAIDPNSRYLTLSLA